MTKENATKQTTHENAPRRRETEKPGHSTPTPDSLALQRALADPFTASPTTLLTLQNRYGNRAVGRAASAAIQRRAMVGLEGGEIESDLQSQIERAQGGGQPIDSAVGTRAGQVLGADFSGVRVHADSQADTLNRSLSAKAFTLGSDIFFSRGAYNPGSSSGKELLAHELTHVVQQGGGRANKVQTKLTVGPAGDKYEDEADRVAGRIFSAPVQASTQGARESGVQRAQAAQPESLAAQQAHPGTIQRNVGFEFEVGRYEVEQLNANMTAPQAAGTTPIQPDELGEGDLEKAKVLARDTGFELQIDEGANDFHLEFVTTGHGFSETKSGRADLKVAMEGMEALGLEIQAKTATPGPKLAGGRRLVQTGEVTGGVPTLPETVMKGAGAMEAEPQTTTGIRMDQLPALMENMAAPAAESAQVKQERAPQRTILAAKSNKPDTDTMRAAAPAARTAIGNFKNRMAAIPVVLPAGFGSEKLVGFMALIYTYLVKADLMKVDTYPKSLFPLLGISNFASMFAMLPNDDKVPFIATPQRFVEINLDAAGLAGTEATPFFKKGFKDQLTNMSVEESAHTAAILGVISRRDWLQGIPQGDDVLTRAFTATAGAEVEALESMGKLNRGEQVGQRHRGNPFKSNTQTDAPILELRRMAGHVNIKNWKDLALDMFDFLVKLNDLETTRFTKRRYDFTRPKR